MNTDLARDARSLEDAFFAQEDRRLIESLRELKALEEATDLMAHITGITDPVVLEGLARLKVEPAAASSLAILPLVMVAWASGTVEPAERKAILDFVVGQRHFQTIDRSTVEAWLEKRPPQALVDAWYAYVASLRARLTEAECKALSADLLAQARKVAEAAGSFLGLGGVSKAEQAVLDRIAAALT